MDLLNLPDKHNFDNVYPYLNEHLEQVKNLYRQCTAESQ